MAAAVTAAEYAAGDCHHVPPLLERTGRRDEGAAPVGRLNHDDAPGEPADDAVPLRKVRRQRWRTGSQFGDDRPCVADALVQPAVLGWVDHVGTTPQHRDRKPAGGERAAMTTVTPAAARSCPSRSATSVPPVDAARDPTTATTGGLRVDTRPATQSTTGACGISRRLTGNSGSVYVTSPRPAACACSSSPSASNRKRPTRAESPCSSRAQYPARSSRASGASSSFGGRAASARDARRRADGSWESATKSRAVMRNLLHTARDPARKHNEARPAACAT
jgi:hypothetical protein